MWNAWAALRQRCNYRGHAMFNYYGGRGIKCCARWASFRAFESDVIATIGAHPGGHWTLDRIKTNGDYRRGNIRWATHGTQSRNRRKCEKRKLTERRATAIRNSTGSSYAVARRFGVNPSTVQRIRNGTSWSR